MACILVLDPPNFFSDFGGDPQFLFQLAAQSRFRGFARFDFTAGEFPLSGERPFRIPLADEETVCL